MKTQAMLLSLGLACLGACAPATQSAAPPETPPAAYALPDPNVTIAADPAPPFTYWAPEGSTIMNHPHQPGIWTAETQGGRVYYFGDACRASEFQRFVGQPLSALPPPPEGTERRTFCTTCAHTDDLRLNRMNIAFDEATQTIEQIFCS